MKHSRTFFIITIIVFLLWIVSVMLIYLIKPTGSTSNWEEIFSGINSLFAGIALIGAIYTTYLQRNDLENTKFEFRYNRNIQILFSQSEYFNREIKKFKFKKNENANAFSDIDEITYYFDTIKNDENEVKSFLEINELEIHSVVTFMHDSFEFYSNILNKEKFDSNEKIELKRIFSRSLNNNLIGFLQIVSSLIKDFPLNNQENEDLIGRAKIIVYKMLRIRIVYIMTFLDFNKK